MSKKKFTSGLDSLFGALTDEAFQDDSPLLDKQKKAKVDEKTKAKATKVARRSTKNFTSDLETLFEQALTERIEEKIDTNRQVTKARQVASARRRPFTGLDALIRRTSHLDMETIEVNIPTKKRVTFVFDKKKLLKLKEIAKQEKVYLKDIIGDVVSRFIDKYEKET